jgi:hypothetical protein
MHPVNVVREPVMATDVAARASRIGLIVGLVGLILAVSLGMTEGDHLRHFFFAYLVAYAFVFTLTLGGIFFVLIQHVTSAKWSVTTRRLGEFAMNTVPALAMMALPLLYPLFTHAGVEDFGGLLWPWIHPHGEHAELVAKKVSYLSANFFAVRMAGYLLIWFVMSRFFMKRSLNQDTSSNKDYPDTVAMKKVSAPCILIFALTISFASFDWLMSTDPTWFSTIFGVYIFGGAYLSIHCLIVLASLFLQRNDLMKEQISKEHYHDLGKFMLAFTVFWAYIAFSQFMLIWYGNIPEETGWFHNRLTEAWSNWSYGLIFTNFFIPFFGILSRHVKRKPKLLGFWAAYILIVHWVDLYWLVMPNMNPQENPFGLVEIGTIVGTVGIFVWAFARQATKHSVLAHGDPRLGESLAHVNY